MGILDRVLGVRRERFSLKNAEIPLTTRSYAYTYDWQPIEWADTSWDALATRGYRQNAAVYQCISTLAFGFSEPPPLVLRDGDPEPDHPLFQLLRRPNPVMSHSELMLYTMVYRAVGGNAYLHKVRGRGNQVVELWPYNAGQMWPIPSAYGWVERYGYRTQNGGVATVDAADVIHLKWPSIDLNNPMIAMPPLLPIAREVDTDSELTRYLYALIANDATPRTVINVKQPMSDAQFNVLAQQFSARHGGENRGGIGIVTGDATISRMAMNLQELAFETLRRIPESRIAGAFRVPAILAGLYVGLEKATYANYKEARAQLTEDTFVPLWRSDAVELTAALAAEFDSNPDRLIVTYDTGKVAALQENEDAKYVRVVSAWDAALMTKNEARALLGLSPVKDIPTDDPIGDVFKGDSMALEATGDTETSAKSSTPILGYHIEAGVVSRNEARAQLGLAAEDTAQSDKIRELKEDLGVIQMAVNVGIPLETAMDLIGMEVTLPPPEPTIVDVTPMPEPMPMLTDEQKARHVAAVKARATRTVEEQMRDEVEQYLKTQLEAAAAAV